MFSYSAVDGCKLYLSFTMCNVIQDLHKAWVICIYYFEEQLQVLPKPRIYGMHAFIVSQY